MAKNVYVFDSTNRLHKYVGTVQVDDNAVLESNQTTVAVGNGRFFNGKEWVNEIINVYHYNGDGYFDYYSVAPQGADLEANETLVAPLNGDGRGMYKPKWDATQGKWIETLSKEEIEELNKPAAPEPDAQDQLNKQLMVRIAGLQTSVATQAKLNATLMKDLTEIKKKMAAGTTTTNA